MTNMLKETDYPFPSDASYYNRNNTVFAAGGIQVGKAWYNVVKDLGSSFEETIKNPWRIHSSMTGNPVTKKDRLAEVTKAADELFRIQEIADAYSKLKTSGLGNTGAHVEYFLPFGSEGWMGAAGHAHFLIHFKNVVDPTNVLTAFPSSITLTDKMTLPLADVVPGAVALFEYFRVVESAYKAKNQAHSMFAEAMSFQAIKADFTPYCGREPITQLHINDWTRLVKIIEIIELIPPGNLKFELQKLLPQQQYNNEGNKNNG